MLHLQSGSEDSRSAPSAPSSSSPYKNGRKEKTAAAAQNNIFDFFFMALPFTLLPIHGVHAIDASPL